MPFRFPWLVPEQERTEVWIRQNLAMKKRASCRHSDAIKDTEYSGDCSPVYASTAFNYLDQESR